MKVKETSKQGKWRNVLNPYWGLLAFCAVSPLSIAATNGAWAATLAFSLVTAREVKSLPCTRTILDPGWALYAVACLLSVLVSLDPVSSLWDFRDVGLIVIYYLFAWNIRDSWQRRRLVSVLLAAASLASVYGLIQFLANWDFLGHYKPDTGRASGFFSLYLTFGEYLVMTSCIGLGVSLWEERPRIKAILIPAVGTMIMGIVLSRSKGGLLGFLAGWCTVLAIRGRKHLLAFLGGFILLVSLLAFAFHIDVLTTAKLLFRVDVNAYDGLAASNTQRLLMWWSAFRISPLYFFNGVGIHALEKIYPAYRHALALQPNQWHLHNNFIHIGVTTGVFGLAAFIFIFLLSLRSCSAGALVSEPFDRGLSVGVFGALVGFLVCGLTEVCWEDSEIRMLLFALLGLQASMQGSASVCTNMAGYRPQTASRGPPALALVERILLPIIFLGMAWAYYYFGVQQPVPTVRMRLLDGLCSLTICAVIFARSQRYRWQSLQGSLVSCLAVYAGYIFTRPVWVSPESYFGKGDVLWQVVGALTLLCLITGAVYWQHLSEVVRKNLFDLAMIAALVLWIGLGVSTHLLLKYASLQGVIMEPSVVALLILCEGATLVFVMSRIAYTGTLVQKIPLGVLAACLFFHALSP